MRTIISFFQGLRGKLILTYTLVTVLALLALEVFALAGITFISAATHADKRAYLSDVLYTVLPKAGDYLQPGAEDIPGLQAWLEEVYASGKASLDPLDAFDSPAAVIVPTEPLLVLAPDGRVVAQAPAGSDSLVGRRYLPPNFAGNRFLKNAFEGSTYASGLAVDRPDGNILMAVPVWQEGAGSRVLGVVVLTIEPPPPMFFQLWPVYLGWVAITGVMLLIAVAPFGALFGFIMSRGLTRRLKALSRAVDAWSKGDFSQAPTDKSKDEIGSLSRRMRVMAERVQALLHTQQQLAALEERNRLARDLHDTVKQQTFATLMQVRAARNLLETDPAEARNHLKEAEALIKNTQQDLGAIIGELRPAALEDQGLAAALRQTLERWSQHSRIPANLHVRGERLLPLEVEQALFRVAQEALSNVARHSRASAVSVLLEYEPTQVCLTLSDNGIGFDPETARGGYGLQSMRERVTGLGGRLLIQPADGGGTTVHAAVPLA